MKNGITLRRILDDVRNYSYAKISRLCLINRKDLQNIQKEFRLSDEEKLHENDAISVRLWVEKMADSEDNPVLYFKEQGKRDNNSFLAISDFQIVLMSKFQLKMLKEFVNEKICIDSTHGTNTYDFSLTTLLTVDEFGAGFSMSFCVSNRTDARAMKNFFDCIKEKSGIINTKVFMSDDAPAYFNAWQLSMGSAKHHLLCTWYVDRR